MEATHEEQRPELADVATLRLAELRSSDDSVLARSLRRILAEADRPQAAVAGWNSAV
ncbi:FxSxx-COOH cyclophane-containing RiPP peptide [Plantactinospora siamensis]|uniref:FxSxx-COOH cyclophane-containing RiPP peptide n=1 Tax=Plantactinospora siamensis TaxID=555372 RepID=A0ABV6NYY3_9ACTN